MGAGRPRDRGDRPAAPAGFVDSLDPGNPVPRHLPARGSQASIGIRPMSPWLSSRARAMGAAGQSPAPLRARAASSRHR